MSQNVEEPVSTDNPILEEEDGDGDPSSSSGLQCFSIDHDGFMMLTEVQQESFQSYMKEMAVRELARLQKGMESNVESTEDSTSHKQMLFTKDINDNTKDIK